jgi:putative peptidoglycan lipid II flippase
LRRIVILYVPVVVSLVISQIGIIIDRNLASRVGEQTIAWMADATRLREFPLGLVSTAVSMAVLPALSRLDLRSGRAQFKATLGLGMRMVLVLIVPATVGLLVLGVPVISLIFQHGQFTPADTAQTARALYGYLLGTPFAAVDLLLVFAFYAQKDTITPVVVGIVCVLIYLAAAPMLGFVLGMGMLGLVIANSIQLTSHAVIMIVLLSRRVGSLAREQLAVTIAKVTLASIIMGVWVYLATAAIQLVLPGYGLLSRASGVAVAGAGGAAVYGLCISYMNVAEARLLFAMLSRRTRRASRQRA